MGLWKQQYSIDAYDHKITTGGKVCMLTKPIF